VQRRQPRVRDVIEFTDGVSIPVQCASDMNRQAMDYNGYHHDTICNNVFCFAAYYYYSVLSAINYPGSFHDSQGSVGLVNMVLEHLGPYKLCVDQGFPTSGDMFDKFVGPMSSFDQFYALEPFLYYFAPSYCINEIWLLLKL